MIITASVSKENLKKYEEVLNIFMEQVNFGCKVNRFWSERRVKGGSAGEKGLPHPPSPLSLAPMVATIAPQVCWEKGEQ
jgi:hypothetical protein